MACFLEQSFALTCPKGTMVNCSNLNIIVMHSHFALGRENMPHGPEVVSRCVKADRTDFNLCFICKEALVDSYTAGMKIVKLSMLW